VRFFLIIISISIFSNSLFCSEKKEKNLAYYPTISFSSETGTVFGGMVYYRNNSDTLKKSVKPNSFYLVGEYSVKKQLSINFKPNLIFDNGRTDILFDFKYKKWPDLFYGLGNDININSSEKYTPETFNTLFDFKRQIRKYWFTSFLFEYEKNYITKSEENGILIQKIIPGSETHHISGIGMAIINDSRDNLNYPQKGRFYSFSVIFFHENFGSNYNFIEYKTDFRNYFSIDEKQVLAVQTLFSCIQKEAPFQKLAHLGKQMRGYESEQFIDNNLLMTRAEYRIFPWETGLKSRFGFVTFIEFGQVFSNFRDLNKSNLRHTFGIGMRFSLFKDEKFNIRFDYGISKETNSITIQSLEEF